MISIYDLSMHVLFSGRHENNNEKHFNFIQFTLESHASTTKQFKRKKQQEREREKAIIIWWTNNLRHKKPNMKFTCIKWNIFLFVCLFHNFWWLCVSLASSACYITTTANSRATDANEVSEYVGAIDSTNCAVQSTDDSTRKSITTPTTTISNATRTVCSRNKFNAE